MNRILRYCIVGIKIFIACTMAFVSIREACLNPLFPEMAVSLAVAAVALLYLILGVGQLFGAFLTAAASRTIRAAEWAILAYLAYRLVLCL